MELIYFFLLLSVDFLSVMLATGKPDPPKDIRVDVNGNTAKISWIIPSNQGVTWSRIYLTDSKNVSVDLDSEHPRTYNDIQYPTSSFEIANLKMCLEYKFSIQYLSQRSSEITTQKFWMTNTTTVTAEIHENVVLTWRTGFTKNDDFVVMENNNKVVYQSQFGDILDNLKDNKYNFDNITTDESTINITVISVNTTDAGLYRTIKGESVDGCCLLVVTDKPKNPTLTIHPEHPFVNSRVTVTCLSLVQRWPVYIPSHLSYQFFKNLRNDAKNNRLIINTLKKLDKGMNIACQATDDSGKVSNMSNTVTLDPYYGPDNVVLTPGHEAINVTEGTTLGPIRCTAFCNPKCIFKWTKIKTDKITIISNETQLTVPSIKKNQAGTYRCRVVNSYNETIWNSTDLSVNVQYSPKITNIWFSNTSNIYSSGTSNTFHFNEDVYSKMTLRIESNPDPKIMFNSSLLAIHRSHKGNGYTDYIYNLPSLKCEDSGNFTIRAVNGIGNEDTRTVNINIYCKPRNATAKSRQIGTKVDTTENIVMHVVSFPLPTVEWCRVTRSDWTVTKERYDYRYKIESEIHIESEKDLGVYGLKICNKLGCIEENITLTPEDKPEAPTNVSVETITFRSVNLSWIVGFNGGHKQTFSVLFKATDNDNWETREEVHTGESTTGSKVYYTLDHLAANKQYHVIVRSTNKHGNRSASLDFKTKVEPTLASPSKSGSDSIPIACGVVGVLLIIVITLLVFFIKRKKRSKTEPKESNVLYAAVDKEQQKSKRRNTEKEDSKEPANAEYASVVKPKSKSKKVHYKEDVTESANDEYAVVDKSNKKIDYTENDNVYANQGDADLLIHQPLKTKPSGRSKNKDGLTYIEVSFTKKPKRRRIIGAENRTDYVDIDFTRKADPLPDSSDQ